MPEINLQETREFLPPAMKSSRRAGEARRRSFLLAAILSSALLLAGSTGCAPTASPGGGGQGPSANSASGEAPEITEETIRERIDGARVREVPEENGAGQPIVWNFNEEEPKEIAVVEKQIDGARATIVLEIKTRSASYMRNPRALAGRIRTEWELKTGWVLRRWEIVRTENISLKYKNLPKPPPGNSNR
jgi:hypothetical protein